MCREAQRTPYILGTNYQQGVSADDYEIIAIDNGSERPLVANRVRGFGKNPISIS
jgi:hypothetical protein